MLAEIPTWFWIFVAPELVIGGLGLIALVFGLLFDRKEG